MIYGYIRVSSTTQNIDRQLEEMYKFDLNKKNIYVDKQSGKDFNRTNYKKMISKLKKNDLLIIKSIDRLGRNYEMIIEEWTKITKIIGCDILVIDMPLLDTREKSDNLIGKFISDIVLQILSFVAENERDFIKQRQAEGIKIAKAKGIKFGRPKCNLPNNYIEIINNYVNKKIDQYKALEILNVSKSTLYRLTKEIPTKVIYK